MTKFITEVFCSLKTALCLVGKPFRCRPPKSPPKCCSGTCVFFAVVARFLNRFCLGVWLRRAYHSQKHNLNLLSHDTAIALISHVVAAGYRIESVFVDTVGDPAKYAAKIRTAFPAIASVVVTTKADSKFPIVSAASIVAKVTRDAQLKHWQFAERDVHDVNFGSGYPAGTTTAYV